MMSNQKLRKGDRVIVNSIVERDSQYPQNGEIIRQWKIRSLWRLSEVMIVGRTHKRNGTVEHAAATDWDSSYSWLANIETVEGYMAQPIDDTDKFYKMVFITDECVVHVAHREPTS